jgi:hypothetical protein
VGELWPNFRRCEEVPKIANEVVAIGQELRLDNDEPDDMTELLESHSQPPTHKELEDMAAQLRNNSSSSNKKIPLYDLQKPKTCRKSWLELIGTCRG